MGFPSTGMEGVYRNPLPEVQRFFREKHGGHHKIYNLCSERAYDIRGVFDRVEWFGFDDHNPCPLEMLVPLMESIHTFVREHPGSTVGIHCKAGKVRQCARAAVGAGRALAVPAPPGRRFDSSPLARRAPPQGRTGLVISAYLLHGAEVRCPAPDRHPARRAG